MFRSGSTYCLSHSVQHEDVTSHICSGHFQWDIRDTKQYSEAIGDCLATLTLTTHLRYPRYIHPLLPFVDVREAENASLYGV